MTKTVKDFTARKNVNALKKRVAALEQDVLRPPNPELGTLAELIEALKPTLESRAKAAAERFIESVRGGEVGL